MYREDGWLAKMAALAPVVITGVSAAEVLAEPFHASTHQNFGGALLAMFLTVVNRVTIAGALLSTMLYMIGSLAMEKELRDAPKFKHAVVGNSVVIVCVVAALWFGNSSTGLWSAIFIAGVATSIFFRRRYGEHLLF